MRKKWEHGGSYQYGKDLLDLSVNTNPYGPPDKVVELICKRATQIGGYPDYHQVQLKKNLANQWKVAKEQVLVGNGASDIFGGIFHGLQPKTVALFTPCFHGYQKVCDMIGAKLVEIPLESEHQFQLEEKQLQQLTEEIDLLVVANPNNPTGQLVGKKQMQQLFEIAAKKQIVVVLDECFLDFCEKGTSSFFMDFHGAEVILVNAFTKSYALAGLRLGYGITSTKELAEQIAPHLAEWNVSYLAQEVGNFIFNWNKKEQFLTETREKLTPERVWLTEALTQMGCLVYPSCCNFIMVYDEKLPWKEELLKQKILIRDLYWEMGQQKGFYRIAVRSLQENQRLVKAWKGILQEYETRRD